MKAAQTLLFFHFISHVHNFKFASKAILNYAASFAFQCNI